MSNSRLLIQLQEDATERLCGGAAFEDIKVLCFREGETRSEAERAIGALNEEGGKRGAIAIVMMPRVLEPNGGNYENAPGPLVDLIVEVNCIEHVNLNASADGSGVTAEEMAWSALRLLHRFFPLGYSGEWYADTQRITPLANLQEGLRGYRVRVRAPAGVDGLVKLARPILSAVDVGSDQTTITATHADGSAALYYSTDESLPRKGGAGSNPYTGPVTVSDPFVFRCVATRAEYEDSNPAYVKSETT